MLIKEVWSIRLLRIGYYVSRPLRQLTTIVTTEKNFKKPEDDDHESDDAHNTDEQSSWENETDEFTSEFLNNRIKMTTFQKFLLGVGSSLAALINPRRQDMIAALGETTGEIALLNMQQTMNTSPEGQRILVQRPRINTRTVDMTYLRNLSENTFGHTYVKFLDDNHVTPDSRMSVRFVRNSDLAYVMTRYRECHDIVHTILGMPTNMLGEVTVKWVEAFNNGLPMCYGGALFGAVRLRPKQRRQYINKYLPWAIKHGKQMKPLMPVYWEERWEQDIQDLRSEMGIALLK